MSTEYDNKIVYFSKNDVYIGIVSIGYAEPYEFTLTDIDGSEESIQTDFISIETFGITCDAELNQIDKGFRTNNSTICLVVQDFLEDGWTIIKEELYFGEY